jgi:serine/threonine protein kinase
MEGIVMKFKVLNENDRKFPEIRECEMTKESGSKLSKFFRAKDSKGDRYFLKQINPLVVDSEELRLIKRYHSPYLMRIYGERVVKMGKEDINVIVMDDMFMDDMDCRDLDDYFEKNLEIEPITRARIFLALLYAVKEICSRYCHKDIKPGNVLLYRDRDGNINAKLTDFDTATSNNNLTILSRGTPAYSHPAVLRRVPGTTVYYDLYSLGVILYELYSGKRLLPCGEHSLPCDQNICTNCTNRHKVPNEDTRIDPEIRELVEDMIAERSEFELSNAAKDPGVETDRVISAYKAYLVNKGIKPHELLCQEFQCGSEAGVSVLFDYERNEVPGMGYVDFKESGFHKIRYEAPKGYKLGGTALDKRGFIGSPFGFYRLYGGAPEFIIINKAVVKHSGGLTSGVLKQGDVFEIESTEYTDKYIIKSVSEREETE